jgi:mRNA-degrading endonuclease YafQ of YafQ-DinJ toxin-antitoxin module
MMKSLRLRIIYNRISRIILCLIVSREMETRLGVVSLEGKFKGTRQVTIAAEESHY